MSTEEREIPEKEIGTPAAAEKQDSGPVGDLKRRVTAGAVALVTSASVLVGGIFHSPALLPDDQELAPQVAWTESDDDDLDGSGDDGDSGSGEESVEIAQTVEETEAPPEVWDDQRRRWQRLPAALRWLAIPLCAALGLLLFSGSTALFGTVLGAIAAKALGWVLLLAALVLGFAAAVKSVFPDLPLKKILNKRSLTGVLLGGAALAALDLLLPLFWADYTRVELLVRALGVLGVIGTAAGSFAVREKRRRDEEALPEAEPEEPEEEEEEAEKPMTREDILALADSVSRKR